MELFLKNLWRWKVGLPDLTPEPVLPLEEIRKIQWVPEFETLMRNRMLMGYFRYMPLTKQPKGKYNNMESAEKRLNLWKQTGNDELLVDIANLCMIEYVKGVHPSKHFKSEDDGEHVTTGKHHLDSKGWNVGTVINLYNKDNTKIIQTVTLKSSKRKV